MHGLQFARPDADRMSILSRQAPRFTAIERGSFELGVARRPDAIVGTRRCDIGPPWAPTSTAARRSGSGTTWSDAARGAPARHP